MWRSSLSEKPRNTFASFWLRVDSYSASNRWPDSVSESSDGPSIRFLNRTPQPSPAHQFLDGLAGSGLADAQEGGHISDRMRVRACY